MRNINQETDEENIILAVLVGDSGGGKPPSRITYAM